MPGPGGMTSSGFWLSLALTAVAPDAMSPTARTAANTMRALRIVFAAVLAVGLMASGATAVSANDNQNPEDVIPPGPGMAELRHAIDDFRASLADLRAACQAERDADVGQVPTA